MGSLLSERGRTELNNSIIEYFRTNGFSQALAVFEAEAPEIMKKKEFKECSLVKKWSCITRLNESNVEMEKRIKVLENDISQLQDPQKLKAKQQDKLPSEPCRHTLRGHRDTITAVAFHPFDSLCYTASADGTGRAWDFETGENLGTLRGHTAGVNCIAVALDGKLVATGSADTTVKVYDSATKECLRTLHGHEEAVYALAWMGDGTLLSGGRDQSFRVWDGTGTLRHNVPTEEWIRAICVNGRGPMVATTGSDDGCQPTVRIWAMGSPPVCSRVIAAHDNIIECIAFTIFEADEVIIDRFGTAEQKRALREIKARRKDGAPPEDGRYILSGARDKNVKLFDIATGVEIFSMEEHENWVRAVGFSPNGKTVVSCSEDNTVRLWDIAKGRVVRTIAAHDHFVTCQALHPHAKPLFLTGSADHSVKVWPCI